MRKGIIIVVICVFVAFFGVFSGISSINQPAFASDGLYWSEFADELTDDWGEGSLTITKATQFAGMYEFVGANKSGYVFTINKKIDLSAHVWEPLPKNTNTYIVNYNVIGTEVENTSGTVYNGFSRGNVTVNFGNDVTEFFGLKRLNASEIEIVGGDVQYKDGSGAVEPEILINGVTPNETYEVVYGANNTDGTDSGSVTVRALPTNTKHFGEVTLTFDIATLSDITIDSVTYNKTSQVPTIPDGYVCDNWYYKGIQDTEYSILDIQNNNFINAGAYKASATHAVSNAKITITYEIVKKDNPGEIYFVNANDDMISSEVVELGDSQFINVKGGSDETHVTYTINGETYEFLGSLYKANSVGTIVFNAVNGDGVNVDKLEASLTLTVKAPDALMLPGKTYDGETCDRNIDFTLYTKIGDWQYKAYGEDGYYALDEESNAFVDAGYYRLELQPNGSANTIFASFTIAKSNQPELYFIDSDNNRIDSISVKYADTISLRTMGGVLGAELSLEVEKLGVTAPTTADYLVTSTDSLLFIAKIASTKNYNEVQAMLIVMVEEIDLSDSAKIYYSGEEKYAIEIPFDYQEKDVVLTLKAIVGGEEVILTDDDYTLVWDGNKLEAGTHTASFIGKGNFTGEIDFTLNITRISPLDLLMNEYTFDVGSTEYAVNSVLPNGWYVLDTNFENKIVSNEWTKMSVAFDINSVDYPSSHLGYYVGEEEYITATINYVLVGSATITFIHYGNTEIVDTTMGATINLDGYASEKQGYDFSGWEYKGSVQSGEFIVKEMNVEFVATWTASDDTPYKVVHYVEELDGSYKRYAESTFEGTTDESVSITTSKVMKINGFTFDDFSNENTVASGVISADGSLVLALYYTRNSYDFSFSVGEDSEATGEPITFTKKYQESFDMPMGEGYNKVGYNLIGWARGNASFNKGESYTVSASEVGVTLEFVAKFELKDVTYTVSHYYGETIIKQEQLVAKFGEEVTAIAGVEGYIFDTENEANVISGILSESALELKLYYTAITFEIVINNDGEDKLTIDKNYGDKFVLPTPSVNKEGYKFGGWMVNGKIYNAGKEIEIYEDMEITPVWHKFAEIPGVNGVEKPSEEQVEPIELTGSTIGIIVGVCGGVALIALAFGLYARARKKRL